MTHIASLKLKNHLSAPKFIEGFLMGPRMQVKAYVLGDLKVTN